MQRAPMGSSLRLSRSLILKVLGIILILGAITYVIDNQFGSYYAWVFIFFIALNGYFGWRAYQRTTVKNDNPYQTMNDLPTGEEYQIDADVTISKQKDNWVSLESQYTKCPSCDARMIPGLDYCEECGDSFSVKSNE